MNPYEVLGVPENATANQIRDAYRKLVKQYHPDQYQYNPLKELANEKLKEVNEAYETLNKKAGGAGQSGWSSDSRQGGRNYAGGNAASFERVNDALGRNDLRQAEELLMSIGNRNGEWHYLMGVVRLRQGNANMARTEFEMAMRMEPNNMVYRQAYESLMNSGRPYRKNRGGDVSPCSICAGLYCAACCCECMGGDLIPCC
mgnify:CR=1 FL=1